MHDQGWRINDPLELLHCVNGYHSYARVVGCIGKFMQLCIEAIGVQNFVVDERVSRWQRRFSRGNYAVSSR